MIPGLDVAGLLTSLGTAAITKAIDKITDSCNDNSKDSGNIVTDSKGGRGDLLMRPINVTINLNVYVDKELVDRIELYRKENQFIDDISKTFSLPDNSKKPISIS